VFFAFRIGDAEPRREVQDTALRQCSLDEFRNMFALVAILQSVQFIDQSPMPALTRKKRNFYPMLLSPRGTSRPTRKRDIRSARSLPMSASLTLSSWMLSGWKELKTLAASRWRSGAEGDVKSNTDGPVSATEIP
jgi:hypothetical protein